MKDFFRVMNQDAINENMKLYEIFLEEYGLEDNKQNWDTFVDHYANKFDSFMYDYYDRMEK